MAEVCVCTGKTFRAANVDTARKGGEASSVVLVLWGRPWAAPDTPAALHATKKAAKARALSLRGFQCHRSDVVGSQDTGSTYRQCPPNSLASSCCSKQIFNFLKKGFQPTHPPTYQGLRNQEVGTSSRAQDDSPSLPPGRASWRGDAPLPDPPCPSSVSP